jgi:hypothetical protein
MPKSVCNITSSSKALKGMVLLGLSALPSVFMPNQVIASAEATCSKNQEIVYRIDENAIVCRTIDLEILSGPISGPRKQLDELILYRYEPTRKRNHRYISSTVYMVFYRNQIKRVSIFEHQYCDISEICDYSNSNHMTQFYLEGRKFSGWSIPGEPDQERVRRHKNDITSILEVSKTFTREGMEF